eukprot:9064371-Pyramimonas_sp.AAC.1
MRRALRNVVAELFVLSYGKTGKSTAGRRLGTLAGVQCAEGACRYSRARGYQHVGLSRQVYVVACGIFVSGYPGACGLGCHRGARFLDFQGIVLYTVVVVPVSDISSALAILEWHV